MIYLSSYSTNKNRFLNAYLDSETPSKSAWVAISKFISSAYLKSFASPTLSLLGWGVILHGCGVGRLSVIYERSHELYHLCRLKHILHLGVLLASDEMAILQLWQFSLAALGFLSLGLSMHRFIFAPLSKLPGPGYSLFTDLYLMYKEFTGQRRPYIHELHKKFGPVVRLGPNEVSFTSMEAIKEIYQSGGSGYDKTEFYTLFRQFSTRWVNRELRWGDYQVLTMKRTMFSTLDRGTVSRFLVF